MHLPRSLQEIPCKLAAVVWYAHGHLMCVCVCLTSCVYVVRKYVEVYSQDTGDHVSTCTLTSVCCPYCLIWSWSEPFLKCVCAYVCMHSFVFLSILGQVYN